MILSRGSILIGYQAYSLIDYGLMVGWMAGVVSQLSPCHFHEHRLALEPKSFRVGEGSVL